ncbi:MAG: hypothetical protein L6R38_004557 [Xanthoria sp. 2 TBL-2021]|nr:MAG: hypothetical protein L6R38_004557 [Xanthoria sp. 2 TBL-2021]
MTLALGAPSTQATADQEEAENQFSFEALHASHPNAGSEWTMMDTQPTVSQITLRKQLDERNFALNAYIERNEQGTRDFVDQGIMVSIDRLFGNKYCLPHGLMNSPTTSKKSIHEHIDRIKVLTTPKPDFVFGFSPDKLAQATPDFAMAEATKKLLGLTYLREVFLVRENKSVGGRQGEAGRS